MPANEQCGNAPATGIDEAACNTPRQVKHVLPAQLKAEIERADTLLIDVREPGEFAREHIAGAQSVPLSVFDPDTLPRGKRIVVCCQIGLRSHDAATQLAKAGFEAFCLADGLEAWKAAGLPMEVDLTRPISVMRQVQITAGSLVVLGAALAALASPWFLLLSAFVGGGLLMAGVTDSCLMAHLLAKLPYNRPKSLPQAHG